MVYAHLFTMRKHSVENHTPLRNAVPFSLSEDLFVPVFVADSTTLSCFFREDIEYCLLESSTVNGSQLTPLIDSRYKRLCFLLENGLFHSGFLSSLGKRSVPSRIL